MLSDKKCVACHAGHMELFMKVNLGNCNQAYFSDYFPFLDKDALEAAQKFLEQSAQGTFVSPFFHMLIFMHTAHFFIRNHFIRNLHVDSHNI